MFGYFYLLYAPKLVIKLYIQRYSGNWKKCAEHLTERTSSQCRIRYQTIMSTKSRVSFLKAVSLWST